MLQEISWEETTERKFWFHEGMEPEKKQHPVADMTGDGMKFYAIKSNAAIQPSNPTAGHTHQRNQNWKRHVYPNVHHSTVSNSQDMEAT